MTKSIIIEAVRERDIDLLLLEEWCVNPAFSIWFVNRVTEIMQLDWTNGFHSIASDNLGETDLFFEFGANGEKYAILVENKIDAFAQDRQGKRYRLRAEILIKKRKYKNAWTSIVAPQRYLQNDSEVAEYENAISYEEIIKCLAKEKTVRSEYKASILRLAIEQERRGYSPVADIQVTKFWHDYWKRVKKDIPGIMMNEPKAIPAGSDWPIIRFPWMPKKWSLTHKLANGKLDLYTTLSPDQAEKFVVEYGKNGFEIISIGAGIYFRIYVAMLDRKKDFSGQEMQMNEAIIGLKKMNEFGKSIAKLI